MVGGQAWAGETLRQESWEGLGGELTGWTTKSWVTSDRWRGEERRREGRGEQDRNIKTVKDINEQKKTDIMKIH